MGFNSVPRGRGISARFVAFARFYALVSIQSLVAEGFQRRYLGAMPTGGIGFNSVPRGRGISARADGRSGQRESFVSIQSLVAEGFQPDGQPDPSGAGDDSPVSIQSLVAEGFQLLAYSATL